MRYYNKTKQSIPYVVSDWGNYTELSAIDQGEYMGELKPIITKKFAIFIDCDMTFFFRHSDFNLLTKVKI